MNGSLQHKQPVSNGIWRNPKKVKQQQKVKQKQEKLQRARKREQQLNREARRNPPILVVLHQQKGRPHLVKEGQVMLQPPAHHLRKVMESTSNNFYKIFSNTFRSPYIFIMQ